MLLSRLSVPAPFVCCCTTQNKPCNYQCCVSVSVYPLYRLLNLQHATKQLQLWSRWIKSASHVHHTWNHLTDPDPCILLVLVVYKLRLWSGYGGGFSIIYVCFVELNLYFHSATYGWEYSELVFSIRSHTNKTQHDSLQFTTFAFCSAGWKENFNWSNGRMVVAVQLNILFVGTIQLVHWNFVTRTVTATEILAGIFCIGIWF